jgi:hypothetical protein
MSGFVEVARDLFAFLERDFGFSLKSCSDESWGGQLTFVNLDNGVAVKPVYDFSNAFVFVFIYRLVEGKIIDNSLPITDKSQITCFDFNDLLDEHRKMKPAYEYGEDSVYYDEKNGLRNYVAEFATRLKEEGRELLKGDFSRLRQAEEIIKQRARDLHRDHNSS